MNTDPDTQSSTAEQTPAANPEIADQIKSLQEAVGGLTKIVENLQGDLVTKVYEMGVKDAAATPNEAPDQGYDPTSELRSEIENLKTQLTQKDLKASIFEAANTHKLHSTHLLAHVLTQCDIEPTSDGGFNLSRNGKSLGSLDQYVSNYARSDEGQVISMKTPPTPTGASKGGDAAPREITSIDILKSMYPHLS